MIGSFTPLLLATKFIPKFLHVIYNVPYTVTSLLHIYTFANAQDEQSIHMECNCLCKTAAHAYCILILVLHL